MNPNNRVMMHFNYTNVKQVDGRDAYELESLSLDIDELKVTSEFSPVRQYMLLKYLECRRRDFFSSSCYATSKETVIELSVNELASATFTEKQRPIYYMNLKDFTYLVSDNVHALITALPSSLIIIVNGEVTNPTDDTILITKVFDIQSGV